MTHTDMAVKRLLANPRTVHLQHCQYLLVIWCLSKALKTCCGSTFVEEDWSC